MTRRARIDHEEAAAKAALLLQELGLEVRVEPTRPGEGLTRVRAREPGQEAWAALTWYATGSFTAHGRPDAAAYARGPLELHGLCPPSPLSGPGGPWASAPTRRPAARESARLP